MEMLISIYMYNLVYYASNSILYINILKQKRFAIDFIRVRL